MNNRASQPQTMARILIACEYSATVRNAFAHAGHDAMSADILPTDDPTGKHYQGNVLDLLNEPFDLVIAHPPCTYLSLSGVRWLYTPQGDRDEERWDNLNKGAEFFRLMSTFNAPRIAIENPIQHGYATESHGLGKPTQYVQPWEYGHPETKKTGLWLHNLPKLTPTNNVREYMETLPYKDQHRVHYAGGGKGHERSRFFDGIAEAMAQQWGPLL